jgi:RHS repeat-associated protein
MYAYNGDSLRASHTAGGTTTGYVWDVGSSLPVILQETAGEQTTYYVYGLDLIASVTGGTPTYYLTDGLGSTTELADNSGDVSDTYTYDAFGSIRTHTGTSANEFTFTGEQMDGTGLQYLRARYYDPAIGRFITQDPLASIQRYAYVGSNPLRFTDPLGLDCTLTTPWECKVVPVPIWPPPVEVPDIPLPRFDPGNPIEHAKEWWDWIRGSNTNTSEPDFTPWTPNPREPGQLFPPGFQPPSQGPYKWMLRALRIGAVAYVIERTGVLNMCVRPPKE